MKKLAEIKKQLMLFYVFIREQIKGLTKPLASLEQIKERHKKCGPCFFFKPTGDLKGVCNSCSCNVNLKRSRFNKLALKTTRCPEGKWDDIK